MQINPTPLDSYCTISSRRVRDKGEVSQACSFQLHHYINSKKEKKGGRKGGEWREGGKRE